jgi:hypothetical protein
MNVSLGLLDYLPLPKMPFDKVEPVQSASDRVEQSAKALDKRVEKYKYTDAYTYHPHNFNKVKPHRIGETVDFIVWG